MKKKLIIYGALLAIVFAAVYAYSFDPKLDLNGDNAQYLTLGRNMANGHGYSAINVVTQEFRPASHFPPGYPFILSVFMFCGIDSLVFFKVLNGLFLLAALGLLSYVVWCITDNRYLGFACALLPIFSPHLQHFSNIVMSEMSYLFFTVLSIFSLYKYMGKPEKAFYRSPWFYTAIVSAVAAYHIRTVGAAALFALVVFFLFRKEWKQSAAAVGGIILLMLPWVLRNKAYGIESRYFGTIMTVNPWRPEQGTISSFGEMWDKMLDNFDETVIKGFKEGLFPFLQIDYNVPSSVGGIVASVLILAVVFYGAWRLKPLRWYLLAFLAANIGLLMLWHGGNGIRYVVPILPVVYLCFYTGVFALVEQAAKQLKTPRIAQYCPIAFGLMLLPMIPAVQAQAQMAKRPYPANYKNYFAIAKKANRSADFKGKVVSCRKPELFAYYAPNVYATGYLYSNDTQALIRDLVERHVDFVVLDQLGYSSTALYLYPAIVANMDLFTVEMLQPNPETYLLRFDRERAEEKLRQ